MYKLTLLRLDLSEMDYTGMPLTGTLPYLASHLIELLYDAQSYGTILNSINQHGAYARASRDRFNASVIVLISRLD